jgi:HlyD family secretion protein
MITKGNFIKAIGRVRSTVDFNRSDFRECARINRVEYKGLAVKKTRLIVICLLLATVGGIAYYYITRANHSDTIILYGNVDIRQVDLGFRVSGKIASLNVDEGDQVKQGQVLATLDKTPYVHEKDNQAAQLRQTLANLEKNQHGNRPQEIQEAKALVREKEVAYENAQKTTKRQAELVKRKLAAQQNFDDANTQMNEAEAQLRTAQEALKLSQEGFRKEDIAAASAASNAAQARLNTALLNISDTTLVAPNDGTILTRVREIGTIVAAGDIVYILSLDKPVWIRAYVSETDLGRIKPGMKVQITTDAHPHNPLMGQIGFISPQAEFTPKNVESPELRTQLVYRIRITVDDPQGLLRQGMPVTVTIKALQPT